MVYSIDYFIRKFEALDNWCMDVMDDGNGNHCSLGHCGSKELGYYTNEAHALITIIGNYYNTRYNEVTRINDGGAEYMKFGKTPKERIINVLYEVKAAQAVKQVEVILNDATCQSHSA